MTHPRLARRFTALAAGLALTLAAAAMTAPYSSPGRADLRDFGWDGKGVRDELAVEKAQRWLRDQAGPTEAPGAVVFPRGQFRFSRPAVAFVDGVEFRGAGAGESVITTMIAGSGFLVGAWDDTHWRPGLSLPSQFAADHRVDAFGKLDSSLAPTPGARSGLRSKGDHTLSFFSSPPASLDWEKVDCLTLDWIAEGPDGKALGGTPYFGSGDYTRPSPISLSGGDSLSGKSYRCYFVLAGDDAKTAPFGARKFDFGDPSTAVGPQRVSLELNLAAATIRAWVNGLEVPVSPGYGSSPTPDVRNPYAGPPLVPGSHLAPNDPCLPWKFFGSGRGQADWGEIVDGQRGRQTYYGFRLSNASRYDSDVNGRQALRFGQTGPLDDDFRVNDARDAAHCLACLDTTTPPTGGIDGRFVELRGGPDHGRYLGLFSPALTDQTAGTVGNVTFRGLGIRAGALGIGIGHAQNVDVIDCHVAGWDAVGNTGDNGANYDHRILGGQFYGRHSWFAFWSADLTVRDPARSDVGRYVGIFDGCNAIASNVRTANENDTRAFIRIAGQSSYGDDYAFEHWKGDRESVPPTTPALGFVVAERSPAGMNLSCDDFATGPMPPGVAPFALVDPTPNQPGAPKGVFLGRNLRGAAIRADRSGWDVKP